MTSLLRSLLPVALTVAALTNAPAADRQASALGLPAAEGLPERLEDTGLFVPGSMSVRPDALSFTPQYRLWSDGATKRRWVRLPPGTYIDGALPDAWVFPPGTKFWKQFSHGQPVETRLIERLPDGTWRYLAFVWNADGRDARLAPDEGISNLVAEGAPDGRYRIPSRDDCRACHEGAAVPVLGFSALQLSPDRDPLAPDDEPLQAGGIDLDGLIGAGLLRNVPASLLAAPPRIRAPSPTARAALGYLHANCGHCHNAKGPLAELELDLAQSASPVAGPGLLAMLDRAGDEPVLGLTRRVVPGSPERSLLAARMRSRNPFNQMPPLGTRVVDRKAMTLVDDWIGQLSQSEETIR